MSAGIAALTLAWKKHGLSPEDLKEREDGTLAATERTLARETSAGQEELPVGEEVELRDVIGRGGMGIVRAALQPSVRREVAVKHIAFEGSDHALRSLLKEAWVGGSLEHPNIVPVHTLAPHESGAAVVMKRIEGRSWREALRGELPESARDPLTWHLRVFGQVCNAIAFAHSRGVLHLDLKPANVMIGAFGEVYVVDWGLAAGVEGAPSWLAPASAISSVAGTPEYMAPELATGAGKRIDIATDVYLLTAILHEIVVGTPPHRAETVMARLLHAYRSEPVDIEGLPAELGAILHRGMHVDPAQRYASVGELQAAVDAFVQHREAGELVEDARREIGELEATLSNDGDETSVQREFGGARFALRAATEAWAEHPALPELTQRLYEPMVKWALDIARPDLAESYLRELDVDSPSLRGRLADLQAAEAERAKREADLESLAEDHDLDLSGAFRRRLAVGLGLLFLAVNVAMGWLEREGIHRFSYTEMWATSAAMVGVFGPYAWFKRRELFRNRANSSLYGICILTFVMIQGHWLVCIELGLPFSQALGLTPMLYLLAFGAVTALLNWRFFWSPLIQVPTLLLTAFFPEWTYEIVGVGGSLSAAMVGLAWRGNTP
ncbi:MAG: serine/threonine-protein kinase [Myxococcota bacterium]